MQTSRLLRVFVAFFALLRFSHDGVIILLSAPGIILNFE
jgi:hypothetical protein